MTIPLSSNPLRLTGGAVLAGVASAIWLVFASSHAGVATKASYAAAASVVTHASGAAPADSQVCHCAHCPGGAMCCCRLKGGAAKCSK